MAKKCGGKKKGRGKSMKRVLNYGITLKRTNMEG